MGGMAEEKKGASALSSSSSRSATSHSDDKTEAKSATRRTSSGKQSTSRTTSPRKRTTAKTPRASRTTKAATAAAVANGEVPAQSIPVADPSQFGRIAVMDVTPNEESGRFPARVELGEPFKVTAQVFIEAAPSRCHRHRAQPPRQGDAASADDLHQPRPRPLGGHAHLRRAQRRQAVAARIRRHQAPAGRMERHRRRMGGHLQVLAA